jgi:hypothetical protein
MRSGRTPAPAMPNRCHRPSGPNQRLIEVFGIDNAFTNPDQKAKSAFSKWMGQLNFFQHHWKNFPPWIRKATASMKKLFDEYTEAEADDDEQQQLPPPSRRKLPPNSDDLYERAIAVNLHLLTGNKNKRQRRVGQLDEYYESLGSDLNSLHERERPERDDPLAWWLTIGRNRYPILFKMATDYLSCPCTSCDCERAFSSARRTVTNDRNCLGGETIEATQLLKNWLRTGVVKSSLADLEKHVQKLDKNCSVRVAVSTPFSSTSTETDDFDQSQPSYGS